MIATRVGVFAEDLRERVQGDLVPADDAKALSQALEFAVQTRPRPLPMALEDTWVAIGHATRNLYGQALDERARSTVEVRSLSEP
jgi:hypothetical protein